MQQLTPISEVSRTLKITPRAIRFYEERDLVASRRNRLNQRCYDQDGQRRLALIVKFRAAELGLDEIGRLLDTYGREGESAAFREMSIKAIAAKAARFRSKLSLADSLLAEFSSASPTERAA